MKKILTVIFLLTSIIGFSGCEDDVMDEITELNFDRALSPTDLSVIVFERTGVRLNWKAVRNANTYSVEIFDNADFSGSPVKAVDDITFNQVPYTITGLEGQKEYFARVKAIGEGIDDSKWITASFTTDAEQILHEVNLEKVTPNSVTLTWPAGEIATSIVLTPGDITHNVTSEEIAKGEALVTGLTEETNYTATLMNGEKIRGTRTFATPLDLGGAIPVTPADNLVQLVSNAKGGEVFALMPGVYTVNEDVSISKSISIKGAKPASKPVLVGAVLRVSENAGLSLKDLVFDGTGAKDNNQCIIYTGASDTPYESLTVENCEIKNYVKGVIYINVKALVESVTFKGNLLHDIECNGGDFVDFRSGLARTFLFENNTVYNSIPAGTKDIFRMDGGGSTNFPDVESIMTIRNNTFYNVGKSTNRYLYIRLAKHQIHFTKNLIANTTGYYSNQSATKITTLADNNYYEAPNFTQSTASGAINDTGKFTSLNPEFANPAQGDFTLGSLELKAAGIGAARWR